MNISGEKGIAIGLDIGGTSLRATLVGADGVIVGPFFDEKRDGNTFAQIERMVRALLDSVQKEGKEVSVVGVGLAGLVERETGILVTSPSMTDMEGTNFEQEIASIAELSVTIYNDANAAGYGEWRFGAGVGSNSCVALFIGTGVGGAIILNGQLETGIDGVAGEVGHMVLDINGPQCPCGGKGCLEQLGSGGAITKKVLRGIASGERTSLRKLARKRDIVGEDIADAAIQGDELALAAYKEAGTWVGVGVANLANLLNVEVVILGGGVMTVDQLVWPSIIEAKDMYTMSVQKKRLHLIKGKLGRRAGAIGAGTLALHHNYKP